MQGLLANEGAHSEVGHKRTGLRQRRRGRVVSDRRRQRERIKPITIQRRVSKQDHLCMVARKITCPPCETNSKDTKTGLCLGPSLYPSEENDMYATCNEQRVSVKTVFVSQPRKSRDSHMLKHTIQRRASAHDHLCIVATKITCPPRATSSKDTKTGLRQYRLCIVMTKITCPPRETTKDTKTYTTGMRKRRGFIVANASCCPSSGTNGLCIPNQTPCENRTTYVFWDQFHPTEAANRIIAINSYNGSDPALTYPMDIKHLVQT
ncbi:GDSL esterase/lipase [Glycine soja]